MINIINVFLVQMKHELDSCKQSLAQSELTSHQLHTTSEMREADYNSAIKSRDEALRDAKALAARIESLEEALQQQVSMGWGLEGLLFSKNLVNIWVFWQNVIYIP